jgi:hypothetical protein
MIKTPFLVSYDYGTGGVWAVVCARSEGEIMKKFPKVVVVNGLPAWMSLDRYNKLVEDTSYDIDLPPQGWMATL